MFCEDNSNNIINNNKFSSGLPRSVFIFPLSWTIKPCMISLGCSCCCGDIQHRDANMKIKKNKTRNRFTQKSLPLRARRASQTRRAKMNLDLFRARLCFIRRAPIWNRGIHEQAQTQDMQLMNELKESFVRGRTFSSSHVGHSETA